MPGSAALGDGSATSRVSSSSPRRLVEAVGGLRRARLVVVVGRVRFTHAVLMPSVDVVGRCRFAHRFSAGYGSVRRVVCVASMFRGRFARSVDVGARRVARGVVSARTVEPREAALGGGVWILLAVVLFP